MHTSPAWQILQSKLSELNHPAPDQAVGQFKTLCSELLRWNKSHNLTGQRDEGGVLKDLFLDGLALAPWLKGQTLLDIGSGGGFPGFPLALALPALQATLLEPRAKRISFQQQIVRLLGLSGRVIPCRGRADGPELAGRSFDTITLRAVGSIPESLALARPYLHAQSLVLLPRAAGDRAEALELGLSVHQYGIEGLSPRIIVAATAEAPLFHVKQ